MQKIASSYWTVGVFCVGIVVGHVVWGMKSCHVGEVISGCGAALIVLGIYVASRPYIRNGLQPYVIAALPRFPYAFVGSTDSAVKHRERVEAEKPAVVRDVWAERIIAVIGIMIGTVLNGYGTPIARAFGWSI